MKSNSAQYIHKIFLSKKNLLKLKNKTWNAQKIINHVEHEWERLCRIQVKCFVCVWKVMKYFLFENQAFSCHSSNLINVFQKEGRNYYFIFSYNSNCTEIITHNYDPKI